MKGKLEKQKEVLECRITLLREMYGVTKLPILKFIGEDILDTIKLIDEAKKDLWDHWHRNLIHEGLEKWLGKKI